jgi:hypothetical protein
MLTFIGHFGETGNFSGVGHELLAMDGPIATFFD